MKTIAGLESLDERHDSYRRPRRDPRRTGRPWHRHGVPVICTLPHMTVAENMGFGLAWPTAPRTRSRPPLPGRRRSCVWKSHLEKLPKSLSGGQRQRRGHRAGTHPLSPEVFLFDEPLSNLDAALQHPDAGEKSPGCTGNWGATMIYVTHDQVEAMTMADRIVVCARG